MADKKITQLTNITGANLVDADEFVVVDISADETKAITLGELKEAFDSGSGFVRITGDTMTGDLGLSGADITFGDNDKAIFGAGSDLQIYHSGTHSYIKDSGTGNLNILASTSINLLNGDSSDYMARFNENGSNQFFYDGSQKLATTSTGVDITGTLTSDGLLVEGEVAGQGASIEAHATVTEFGDALLIARSDNASNNLHAGVKIQGSNNPFYIYQTNGANTNKLRFNYNAMSDAGGQMTIDNNGDISFYEDTGTTPKFFWDASAESLGIGTSSPAVKLHTTSGVARTSTAKTETAFFATDDIDDYRFGLVVSHKGGATGADRYASIDSASYQVSTDTFSASSSLVLQQLGGNVGIGTSNVGYPLTVNGYIGVRGGNGITFLNPSNNYTSDIYNGAASGTSDLRFKTQGSERMRIDNSGNVGIGTSSPTTKLQSKGGSISTPTDNAGLIANASASFVVDHANDYGLYTGYVGAANDAIGIAATRTLGGTLPLSLQPFGGNVGIGTSSPTYKLETKDGDIATVKLTSAAGGNAVNGMRFRVLNSANTAQSATLGMINAETVNAWGGALTFSTKPANSTPNEAVTERMRIDSSGVVRIGGQTGTLKLGNDATYYADIEWEYNNNELAFTANNTANFTFNSNGSERMRLDSSGNLLVGKTIENTTTVGIQARADGLFAAVKSGAESAIFGRNTNDGDIVKFRKDGTTVGSIGTANGYIEMGSSDTGLRFYTPSDAIIPANPSTNSARDAAIDLGISSQRFKDLYLSGGVYLGGTGAANKLDDYEEGTWAGTTVITSATSSSVTDETYTKIGQIVHVSFSVSFSGASGGLYVTGLPFLSSKGGVAIGREDTSNGYAVFGRMQPGSTTMDIWDTQGIGNPSPFNVSSGGFKISFTYHTNA